MGDDHPGERDDGHLGGPAADVADGVAAGLADREVGPDGGGQRFVDEPGLFGAGADGGLGDGAALDAGYAGGDTDHDLGLEDPLPALDAGDEVVEHPLGHDEVGDHAFAHGPDDVDRLRGAPDHLERLPADGQDLVAVSVEGDQRGLVDDDPLTLDVDQHGRGPEVDPDLLGPHRS